MLQNCFAILLILGSLMGGLHDWIDVPGWTNGQQIRAALGMKKMLIGTAVNGLFPGLVAALAIYYWDTPAPSSVRSLWVVYCAVGVVGAITMWWIPYFRGTDQKTKDFYSKMCAGTIQVLPPHGDNPRPNLFHVVLHAVGATSLILALAIWL